MSDSKIDSLRSMGKRRFLKTLAEFGVSGTTLQYITKDAVAQQTSDVQKEIPYVKALQSTGDGKRTPVYGTVTRDKWLRINAAEKASQILARRLSKKFNHDEFEVGVTVDKSTGSPKWKTTVSRLTTVETIANSKGITKKHSKPTFSLDELKTEIPDSLQVNIDRGKFSDKISVDVIAKDENRVDCGNYYDDVYRPVPGGCDINNGSTCSRAQEQDGNEEYVMVTCGHTMESIDQGSGGDVIQPENGTKIGYTDSSMYWNTKKIDIGYFKPTGSVSVTDQIADENSEDYKSEPIAGPISWEWIKNEGYDATVFKQGARTQLTVGSITDHRNGQGQKAFWTTAKSNRGDSGGIHYAHIAGVRYCVGAHAWIRNNGTESGGNSAEKIEEHANIWIY